MATATRAQLKLYFGMNCIPTPGNFSDLIDSMINQTDDGIMKSSGNPLLIAGGDTMTTQPVLNLYSKLSDANPAWMLQLNPRSNQTDPSTGNPGFSISDASGSSQLFIEQTSNNIGLGTIKPQAKLDINGDAKVAGNLTVTGTVVTIGQGDDNNSNRLLTFARDTGDDGNATFNYKPGGLNNLSITGAGKSGDTRYINLWDDVWVNGNLNVGGALAMTGNISGNGKISSPMWKVTAVLSNAAGGLPLTGTFTSSGGTLLILVSGSGYTVTTGLHLIGMSVTLDNSDTPLGNVQTFINQASCHQSFIPATFIVSVTAGEHAITLTALNNNTYTDNDFFNVTVMELPF